MKKNSIFLTIFLALSATTSQAGIITPTVIALTVPATAYLSFKAYQAGGDVEKTKRLVRQDKDVACDTAIETLEKNCTLDLCKELKTYLEQAKSTPSQKIEDKIQESIEAAKNSDAYKSTEEASTGYYNAGKKAFDDWMKPKK